MIKIIKFNMQIKLLLLKQFRIAILSLNLYPFCFSLLIISGASSVRGSLEVILLHSKLSLLAQAASVMSSLFAAKNNSITWWDKTFGSGNAEETEGMGSYVFMTTGPLVGPFWILWQLKCSFGVPSLFLWENWQFLCSLGVGRGMPALSPSHDWWL